LSFLSLSLPLCRRRRRESVPFFLSALIAADKETAGRGEQDGSDEIYPDSASARVAKARYVISASCLDPSGKQSSAKSRSRNRPRERARGGLLIRNGSERGEYERPIGGGGGGGGGARKSEIPGTDERSSLH